MGQARSTSILVVEDDPEMRLAIQRLLSLQGYQVRTAAHAGEAQAHLYDFEFEPDLILMDIHLPGLGGLEFAEELKRSPRRRHIPIVAMTAFSEDVYRPRAFDAGCAAFLSKPFHTNALLSVVAMHVRKNGATR